MRKLDKFRVVMGQLIKVTNIERENAKRYKVRKGSPEYISLQIENLNGEGERCLLFTEIEMADLEKISLPEELMKKCVFGRLYPLTINKRKTYIVKIKNRNNQVLMLRLCASSLKKADDRAHKHPKSITTKPAMVDLFD